MSWKQLTSKEVYKNKWIRVTEDEVMTDDGRQLQFGVVHKQPFALIIPWDGEKLTLVGQYRYMVGGYSWEFPQGHFEHENILATAKEELREETGLIAKNMCEAGSFWIGPGGIDQECNMFIATELTQSERRLETSEEGMECKAVTLNEFWSMVENGEIKDGPSLAAMSLATNVLKFF
ncbi:NUDIX hydrolase [Candidatus Uhrbacteria bacterium]|nr:NUDIX hydrolase [Candidatus Uhrbacteria bacterium]